MKNHMLQSTGPLEVWLFPLRQGLAMYPILALTHGSSPASAF